MAQKAIGFVVALMTLIGTSTWVAAQSPLEGAWELQESTRGYEEQGLMLFHGQHYAAVTGASDRPFLGDDAQTATADQLRAAWEPFVGNAGMFELTGGDTLVMHVAVAKNNVSNGVAEWRCTLEDGGNTLVLTLLSLSNRPVEGGETVRQAAEDGPTLRYRRVE